jgi:hypothetical protein
MESSSAAHAKLALGSVHRRTSDPDDKDAQTVRYHGQHSAAGMGCLKSSGFPAGHPDSPETILMAENDTQLLAGDHDGKAGELDLHAPTFSPPRPAPGCSTRSTASTRPIFGIAEDCFTHILQYMSSSELLTLAQVNQQLRRQSACNTLWKELCLNDYGPDAEKIMARYKVVVEPEHSAYFKKLYQSMLRYEIELFFTTGPRANEVIRVACLDETAIGRSRQNDICILQVPA